jgi:hypothetical protein
MRTLDEVKESVVQDSTYLINPSHRKLVLYGFHMGGYESEILKRKLDKAIEVLKLAKMDEAIKEIETMK